MPIAEGVYVHYENGTANGITERWSTGGSTINITFTTPAYNMTATITRNRQNKINQFQYEVDELLGGVYHLDGTKLQVERTLPPDIKLKDTLVWSDESILDLPFLATKGQTILHIERHGTVPVFAPHLRSGDRAGDLAKKSVQNEGKETITIGDKSYLATKYRYRQLYWLDEYSMVLKVKTDNYEMVLTEYKRLDSEF